MRFCFVTTFFPPYHFGGDAVFTSSLASLLACAGHHVEVVHCRDSFELLRGDVAPAEVAIDPRVKVHTLHSAVGPLSPIGTYLTGRPLAKHGALARILGAGFDVTHWHNASLMGAPGALALGSGLQLCTLHDYWHICATHVLFRNNREVCDRRTCFTCTLRHGRPPQLWRRGGVVPGTQRINCFLAPSAAVRDLHRGLLPDARIEVLPHFIPAREPVNALKSGYYFFAGRLEKVKGLQTILPLFTGSRRLVVAGTGSMERELRAMAGASVSFVGRVDAPAMAALYSGATATIVPSLAPETFGLVVLESLQQGTPVLAAKIGALPELIEATAGGLLYSGLTELDSHIESYDASPSLAAAMGAQGRKNLGRYSAAMHLESYLDLIRRLKS